VGLEIQKINSQTRDELKNAIEVAWYGVPLEFIRKLILSMPRSIHAVIQNNGGATKY
jgi:hypothetical protein